MNTENASDIAIAGLRYMASNPDELTRFLALTGVSPDEIRSIAHTPDFMSAILDYFLGNEPTLLAFAASHDLDAGDVAKARQAFSGEQTSDGF